MKSDALELCHQEFKNNSVRFLLAIAIEPGYFQSFEEIMQAVSLESAIPIANFLRASTAQTYCEE